jgi:hypothetical protein
LLDYFAYGGDDLGKRWILNQFNENTVAAAKLASQVRDKLFSISDEGLQFQLSSEGLD